MNQSILHNNTIINTTSHKHLHQQLQQQFQNQNLLNFSQYHHPINFLKTLNLIFFFTKTKNTILSKTYLIQILSTTKHSIKIYPLTSLHKSNPSSKIT